MSLFQLLAKGPQNGAFEHTGSRYLTVSRGKSAGYAVERVALDDVQGVPKPGEHVSIRIPRKGDLLKTVILKGLGRRGNGSVRSALKRVRFMLGGQTLEDFDGEWLKIHAILDGDVAHRNAEALASNDTAIIPFFFSGVDAQPFPLIAVQFQDVFIELDVAPDAPFDSCSLEAEFVHCTDFERKILTSQEIQIPVRIAHSVSRPLSPPVRGPPAIARLHLNEVKGLVSAIVLHIKKYGAAEDPFDGFDIVLNGQSTSLKQASPRGFQELELMLRGGGKGVVSPFPRDTYVKVFSRDCSTSTFSGAINCSMIDTKEIALRVKPISFSYETVVVFYVTHNILNFKQGFGGFLWLD